MENEGFLLLIIEIVLILILFGGYIGLFIYWQTFQRYASSQLTTMIRRFQRIRDTLDINEESLNSSSSLLAGFQGSSGSPGSSASSLMVLLGENNLVVTSPDTSTRSVSLTPNMTVSSVQFTQNGTSEKPLDTVVTETITLQWISPLVSGLSTSCRCSRIGARVTLEFDPVLTINTSGIPGLLSTGVDSIPLIYRPNDTAICKMNVRTLQSATDTVQTSRIVIFANGIVDIWNGGSSTWDNPAIGSGMSDRYTITFNKSDVI